STVLQLGGVAACRLPLRSLGLHTTDSNPTIPICLIRITTLCEIFHYTEPSGRGCSRVERRPVLTGSRSSARDVIWPQSRVSFANVGRARRGAPAFGKMTPRTLDPAPPARPRCARRQRG